MHQPLYAAVKRIIIKLTAPANPGVLQLLTAGSFDSNIKILILEACQTVANTQSFNSKSNDHIRLYNEHKV